MSQNPTTTLEPTVLLSEMRALYRSYVRCLKSGRDRILFLGGDCDPVEVMERGDPALIQARIAIAEAERKER